jgi:hypothetical protein
VNHRNHGVGGIKATAVRTLERHENYAIGVSQCQVLQEDGFTYYLFLVGAVLPSRGRRASASDKRNKEGNESQGGHRGYGQRKGSLTPRP